MNPVSAVLIIGLVASAQSWPFMGVMSSVKDHMTQDLFKWKDQAEEDAELVQKHIKEDIEAFMTGDPFVAMQTLTKNYIELAKVLAGQAMDNSFKIAQDFKDDVEKIMEESKNDPTTAESETGATTNPESEESIESKTETSDESKSENSDETETDTAAGSKTETSGKTDTKSGQTDAESGKTDVESGKTDAESGKTDPESGKTDPESGKTDPESGKTDPESGKTDPESGKLDPESGKTDTESGKTGANSRKMMFQTSMGASFDSPFGK